MNRGMDLAVKEMWRRFNNAWFSYAKDFRFYGAMARYEFKLILQEQLA